MKPYSATIDIVPNYPWILTAGDFKASFAELSAAEKEGMSRGQDFIIEHVTETRSYSPSP